MAKKLLISNAPKQVTQVLLERQNSITISLSFLPTINSWIMDMNYNTFVIKGQRVSVTPNLVFQWKNLLPFGIMVTSKTGLDPLTADAFATDKNAFYVYSLNELI